MMKVVSGDEWSYQTCKIPVKSSPPRNRHLVLLQAGCSSCCPTNSVKALKGEYSFCYISDKYRVYASVYAL